MKKVNFKEEIFSAVLKTLCYADIFDYPLAFEEIRKRLIISRKTHLTQKTINNLAQTEGFYHLSSRGKIVSLRKKRAKISLQKWQIARKTADYLKAIPTIKMIGVSGNLSLNNAEDKDDIDFLIVTAKNSLWTTRLLATVFLEILGKRRRPKDKIVKDKICLNMFLDEEHLALPLKERDLFSAYEVFQMKPLWVKGNTYEKFLKENDWAKKFLANYGKEKEEKAEEEKRDKKNFPLSPFPFSIFFLVFEWSTKQFQLWYMKKRMTNEVIKNGLLRFHPQDARLWVLKEYRKRLEKLGGVQDTLNEK